MWGILPVIGGGSLGFVLYEFLRVYKKRISGQVVGEIFEADYYIILIFGTVVVGVTSAILSAGEVVESIYLGFSLPTCASAILGKGGDTPTNHTHHAGTNSGAEQTKVKKRKGGGEVEEIEEINSIDEPSKFTRFREYLYLGR